MTANRALFTDASVKHILEGSLRAVAAAQTLAVGGWTNDITSNKEEEPLYRRIHS